MLALILRLTPVEALIAKAAGGQFKIVEVDVVAPKFVRVAKATVSEK